MRDQPPAKATFKFIKDSFPIITSPLPLWGHLSASTPRKMESKMKWTNIINPIMSSFHLLLLFTITLNESSWQKRTAREEWIKQELLETLFDAIVQPIWSWNGPSGRKQRGKEWLLFLYGRRRKINQSEKFTILDSGREQTWRKSQAIRRKKESSHRRSIISAVLIKLQLIGVEWRQSMPAADWLVCS